MNKIISAIPILGFAAYSGTGKTTLLTAIIPLLKQQGLRVGLIKHAHHKFDVDQPGKDSYELRKAGAERVLVASSKRWALMVETPDKSDDPDLQKLVRQFDNSQLDLLLVEGFKHSAFPKIELHRKENDHELMYVHDKNIIAIATNDKNILNHKNEIVALNIDDANQVADFIVTHVINKV